jgi:hypothetical protein
MTLGLVFAGIAALGLWALGVGALLFPRPSSRGYGIPLEDGEGLIYVQVAGIRDLALGFLVALLLYQHNTAGLQAAMLAGALVAALDFYTVFKKTSFSVALLPHSVGVVGLLLTVYLLG